MSDFERDDDGSDIYSGMDTNDPGFWDDAPVVHSYTWESAVEDGQLIKCFENRWSTLSGGKPILATAGVVSAFSDAALIEVWNAYVAWKRDTEPTLAEEDKLFATTMNGETLWVIEDGVTFTFLFPSEY